jgi:carbamoyltransferase
MRILSFAVTHDSSVCALNDGKVEFFCKEERISRKKRDSDPIKALELYSTLNYGEIDEFIYNSPSQHQSAPTWFYTLYCKKKFNKEFIKNFDVLQFGHHISHAMLAFINSGFEKSLVLVMDRDGSVVLFNNDPVARESESIYLFNRNLEFKYGFREIYKSFWLRKTGINRNDISKYIQSQHPNCKTSVFNEFSLVKVYEAATTLIGQNPLENGKTMGLSSYGEDLDYPPLFFDGIPLEYKLTGLNDNQEFNRTCFFQEEHLITSDLNDDNYQYYANKAKHVQLKTQEQALNLIKEYVQKTGVKNVCLVGGYALNVVANNYYLKNLPDVNFYFEPVADDTGISIGGAFLRYWQATNKIPESLKHNFYHYYDHSEKINYGETSNIEEIVSMLVDGKSVAVFDGNPEAGPRALGHRSILFDARNPNSKNIINKTKKREWYRPFAGVILENKFEEYFETLGLKNSPFMTINFDAKENAKQLVPGIIHVDGTCRIQTVNSGFLYDLLLAFYEKTGCPMLLNTSFNLAGEALVQTKKDAIKTFENSELDAVYFVDENKIVQK